MTARKRMPPSRSQSTLVERAADDAPHSPLTPRRDPLTRLPRESTAEPDSVRDAGRGKRHPVVRD